MTVKQLIFTHKLNGGSLLRCRAWRGRSWVAFLLPPLWWQLTSGKEPFLWNSLCRLTANFWGGISMLRDNYQSFRHLWNEKQAWPHISPGADTQLEFEKEISKIPINWNPKQVWSKVYCNDIWGCGRGNYGGPRQLRVLAGAQFCDSLLAPVVREACNGTEAASCHSFMT